ncbi:MAG: DUF6152 family protein [Rhodocyclaceae bacterium]
MNRNTASRSAFRFALAAAAASTAIFGGASSVQAHHAFSAEFDAQQPIEVTGVVTKGRWVNPHSWLYLDVKNADGSVTNWGFEFGAPFSLEQKGLTKQSLPVGAQVRIKGFRSKNGQAFGYSTSITLADGKVFQTGGAQDAPAQ